MNCVILKDNKISFDTVPAGHEYRWHEYACTDEQAQFFMDLDKGVFTPGVQGVRLSGIYGHFDILAFLLGRHQTTVKTSTIVFAFEGIQSLRHFGGRFGDHVDAFIPRRTTACPPMVIDESGFVHGSLEGLRSGKSAVIRGGFYRYEELVSGLTYNIRDVKNAEYAFELLDAEILSNRRIYTPKTFPTTDGYRVSVGRTKSGNTIIRRITW